MRVVAGSKYQEKPNFFMRLWFTSTNTYSGTLHVNSAKLYRYSDVEKWEFRSGTVLTLKDGNESVGAVVLARGEWKQMEALNPHLETLADEKCDTGEVLRRVETIVTNVQSTDTESVDSKHSETPNVPSIVVSEQKKEAVLMRSLKKNARNATSMSNNSSKDDSVPTSHMILAEMRIHTSLLRSLNDQFRELNRLLRIQFKDYSNDTPKEDATYQGVDGPFTLSSIASSNPNVFARKFIRKSFTLQELAKMILCPKGKTNRTEFAVTDVERLQSALNHWYGNSYSWTTIVHSVNQFLREVKEEKSMKNIGQGISFEKSPNHATK